MGQTLQQYLRDEQKTLFGLMAEHHFRTPEDLAHWCDGQAIECDVESVRAALAWMMERVEPALEIVRY